MEARRQAETGHGTGITGTSRDGGWKSSMGRDGLACMAMVKRWWRGVARAQGGAAARSGGMGYGMVAQVGEGSVMGGAAGRRPRVGGFTGGGKVKADSVGLLLAGGDGGGVGAQKRRRKRKIKGVGSVLAGYGGQGGTPDRGRRHCRTGLLPVEEMGWCRRNSSDGDRRLSNWGSLRPFETKKKKEKGRGGGRSREEEEK